MKVGFVSIFGKPNAGKSTLLNALMGEKLAIVSPKVQTTRHRIKGILTEKDYQIIFSDTPGIIEPRYKLHEKMMQAVKNSLEDADLALLMLDIRDDWEENSRLFSALKLQAPAVVVLNKVDGIAEEKVKEAREFFAAKACCREVIAISALKNTNISGLLEIVLVCCPMDNPFLKATISPICRRNSSSASLSGKRFSCSMETKYPTRPPSWYRNSKRNPRSPRSGRKSSYSGNRKKG